MCIRIAALLTWRLAYSCLVHVDASGSCQGCHQAHCCSCVMTVLGARCLPVPFSCCWVFFTLVDWRHSSDMHLWVFVVLGCMGGWVFRIVVVRHYRTDCRGTDCRAHAFFTAEAGGGCVGAAACGWVVAPGQVTRAGMPYGGCPCCYCRTAGGRAAHPPHGGDCIVFPGGLIVAVCIPCRLFACTANSCTTCSRGIAQMRSNMGFFIQLVSMYCRHSSRLLNNWHPGGNGRFGNVFSGWLKRESL